MGSKLYDHDVEKFASGKEVPDDTCLIKYHSKDYKRLLEDTKNYPDDIIVIRIGNTILELKDGKVINQRAANDWPIKTKTTRRN